MASAGTITVELTADTRGFERGLQTVERRVQGTESAFAGLNRTVGLASAAIIGLASLSAFKVGADAALASARFRTLGVVVEQVGRNAGYTSGELDDYDRSLRKAGISMIGSRSSMAQLIQAQVDLAQSTDLARVAQDAAVIGGTNSTEAFSRLTVGIANANTVILRSIGLNVNFERSYSRLAGTLGKTIDDLTEQERTQARVDAVMEAGSRIAGAYEASMASAGKVLGSLPRQTENLRVQLGALFDETLRRSAFGLYERLVKINQALEDMGDARIQSISRQIADGIQLATNAVGGLAAVMAGRYVISLGAATVASVKKAQASMAAARAQHAVNLANREGAIAEMNMARLMGTSTTARLAQRRAAVGLAAANSAVAASAARVSVSARAAAVSIGLFRGALALVGGLPGVIAIGLGALVFKLLETRRAAAQAAQGIKDSAAEIAASFAALDEAATLREMGKSGTRLGELQAELDAAKKLANERADMRWVGGQLTGSFQAVWRKEDAENVARITREMEIQREVATSLAGQYSALASARLSVEGDDPGDPTRAQKIAKVQADLARALQHAAHMEALLGEQYDGNRAKITAYRSALEAMLELDVTPSSEQMQEYAASLLEIQAAIDSTAQAEEAAAKARREAERAAEDAARAIQRERDQLEMTARSLYERSMTAQQIYDRDAAALKAALEQKLISQAHFNQAMQHLDDEFARAAAETGRTLASTLREQGVYAGEALMRGILSGANNMKDILKNALINLAISYVMGPVKLALGIASPSKVFRGFGESIGEGLAVGIESSVGRVSQASARMVSAVRSPSLKPAYSLGAAAPGTAALAGAAMQPLLDPSRLPKALGPAQAARDADWLRWLAESNLELETAGFRGRSG